MSFERKGSFKRPCASVLQHMLQAQILSAIQIVPKQAQDRQDGQETFLAGVVSEYWEHQSDFDQGRTLLDGILWWDPGATSPDLLPRQRAAVRKYQIGNYRWESLLEYKQLLYIKRFVGAAFRLNMYHTSKTYAPPLPVRVSSKSCSRSNILYEVRW